LKRSNHLVEWHQHDLGNSTLVDVRLRFCDSGKYLVFGVLIPITNNNDSIHECISFLLWGREKQKNLR
jgi:hypothetical protein